ncbi:exodeoxyribonuclease III [Lujinxingia litoralis]|uniref:Exodeoxyribonuclease III n=1 Tax=Lujinxingia litoralis TaxID=2211119 RepID=A0A328CC08_9DELT|nr:exodeoxyribonuclease III [Lujinxingia litoralis]RAL24671.1 exodeoxyribonuclease III [Lujinxingia litoralis]
MKIYSWNVNGLRACVRKGYLDWLDACEGDIVGLQEVRALPEQLSAKARNPEGWHTYFHPAERKGYSGVGLYARQPFDQVIDSLGEEAFDCEGRVQIATLGKLTLLNVYFPNGSGKNRDLSRIPYKLDFYSHLRDMLATRIARGERILVMGDFNTAHRPIDLARPTSNTKTSGFRPEEREELDRWLDQGWVDTFRAIRGDVEERYTWWSQRGDVRARNIGWRIDYVYASPAAMEFVVDARIHDMVMGSDHCPISVTLNPDILL